MLEDSLMDFRPVEYRGTVMTEEEILKLFYYKFTETPLLKRMDLVRDYFIDEWETLRGRNISDDDKLLLQQKFDKMYVTRIFTGFIASCWKSVDLIRCPEQSMRDGKSRMRMYFRCCI